MKKKFILKTSVIALALIILMEISVSAYGITLNLLKDKDAYLKEDEVLLTVKWTEKLQAVGFTINYDASKVNFIGSPDIAETFYNSSVSGKVNVNWASMDGSEPTQMTFKFKTIAEGEASFSITGADKDLFSNGELVTADSVDSSKASISVSITEPGHGGNPEETSTEPQQTATEGNEQNSTTETNKNEQKTVTETTVKEDNTIAGGKMPHTGIETTILVIIGWVLLLGIIGLKKYKNLSDI